jgi:hypothetical protein
MSRPAPLPWARQDVALPLLCVNQPPALNQIRQTATATSQRVIFGRRSPSSGGKNCTPNDTLMSLLPSSARACVLCRRPHLPLGCRHFCSGGLFSSMAALFWRQVTSIGLVMMTIGDADFAFGEELPRTYSAASAGAAGAAAKRSRNTFSRSFAATRFRCFTWPKPRIASGNAASSTAMA